MIDRLIDWLKDEPRRWKFLGHIFGCVILMFFCNFLISGIFGLLNIKLPNYEPIGLPILTWGFLIIIFILAAIEEVIFRLPLAIAIKFKLSPKKVLIFALFYSTAFGIVHGHILYLFFQGIGGLLLSFLFLKCGGFQKKYFKAFLASTIAHACFNLITAVIILISGGKYL